MLDIREFRREPEKVAQALLRRGLAVDLRQFKGLDQARRELQTELETLQHERNEVSKVIGQAKAAGEDIEPLVDGVTSINLRLDVIRTEFGKVQEELREFLLGLPNIPHDSVPDGLDEAANETLREVGELPQFNFEPRDHVDIAGELLDLEAAARISGARFSVLKGPLARLHRGLTAFMLDVHINEHGYEELYVPYIVNEDTMTATGQLPKFEEDLFKVAADDTRYLIPTAEVPVTSMVRDQILSLEELPIKYVSHTPCFRREAGSYGKDTHGVFRHHQFEKVELVQIVHPGASWQALDELTRHAETILQRLELPYRVVSLCGGDLGFAAAKTLDLEVWLPSQKRYREISSCSNFLDFQARRAQARVREVQGQPPVLVHTLNGSGLAVGRTLIAMLENFQDGSGAVHIPDVLRDYVGGMRKLQVVHD